MDRANKNRQNRQSVGPSSSNYSNQLKEDHQIDSDSEGKNTKDQRTKFQLPTKTEMADMFKKLIQSLKKRYDNPTWRSESDMKKGQRHSRKTGYLRTRNKTI